jgi:hypothetical protein
VRCHFDQSMSRAIEQVYELRCARRTALSCVEPFALVRAVCQWSVVQLFYVRVGRLRRWWEVAVMTAVLEDVVRDGLFPPLTAAPSTPVAAATVPLAEPSSPGPASAAPVPAATVAQAEPHDLPAAPATPVPPLGSPVPPVAPTLGSLVWADSGRGARPGAAPASAPGVRVVDLAAQDVPLPGVVVQDLVAMLAAVPVAEVSGGALVSVVAGCQQAIAMIQSLQGQVVRELAARTPMDTLARVSSELAPALVCTGRLAQDLVVRATAVSTYPVLADAWAAGLIEARKVEVILGEIHTGGTDVPHDILAAVVADGVDKAAELTAPQLTRHVRAALLAAAPGVAEKRRRTERERRSLFVDLAPDAMARLIAYLPAADAIAAFTAIDALAGNAAVDGDTRTIDQRRADAFADVFTGILDRQSTPDGTPLPRKHGQRVALQVSVAASTLLGLDECPGYLGSYGPIPAQVARELAQDATWRRVLTDHTGQVTSVGTTAYRPGADLTRTIQARDVTCTFPGCRQPATRCELDHRVPYDFNRTPADQAHHLQTCEENLHALCKHHHQAKTNGWWQVTRNPVTGVTTWTDRHGYTYARSPVLVLVAPSALIHRPPPPGPGDPPF